MNNLSGYNVFSTRNTTTNHVVQKVVLYTDYTKWRKQYTFNALKTGARYGQDFCIYFDITDYILYYSFDPDRADTHIRKYYIE